MTHNRVASLIKSTVMFGWLVNGFLIVAVGLVYFALAKAGLALATLNQSASPVWPATGWAIFATLFFGYRVLPAVLFGAFAANYLQLADIPTSIAISIGNVLESAVAAAIFNRAQNWKWGLEGIEYLFNNILAITAGSVVSATIGVSALWFRGSAEEAHLTEVFITWWLGDFLAGLILTPALLTASKSFSIRAARKLVGPLAVGAGAAAAVFWLPSGASFVFILFPVLLYALIEGDELAIYFTALEISAIAIVATAEGKGPFSIGTLNDRLVHLQLFMTSIAITSQALVGFGYNAIKGVPLNVLLICWGVSGSVYLSLEQSARTKDAEKLHNLVQNAQSSVKATFSRYADMLHAGAGVYSSIPSITAEAWKSYQARLKLDERFPGMNGIGIVQIIDTADDRKLEKEMRSQGLADFKVHEVPGGDSAPRPVRFVIKLIEPLMRNKKASGLDLASESNRRSAAELARDTGKIAITESVILVQDSEQTPGFLMFRPIYANMHDANSDVATRRRAFRAWVYEPVIYSKFFGEALASAGNEIELRAYDRKAGVPAEIFATYSSARGTEMSTEVEVGQRVLKLEWRKSPNFISTRNTIISWVSLCAAISTLLLTGLVVSLKTLGVRSKELAEELTKELSDSREKFMRGEQRLLQALDGSNDAIWEWNVIQGLITVEGRLCDTLGWKKSFPALDSTFLEDLVHPSDSAVAVSLMAVQISGSEEFMEFKARFRDSHAHWRWVLVRARSGGRAVDGRAGRITGTLTDIDALTRAHELLDTTRGQLQRISDSVPTLISVWDYQFRCRFMNAAFRDFFQASTISEGASSTEVFGPEASKFWTSQFSLMLAAGPKAVELANVVDGRGDTKHVVVTLLPERQANGGDAFYFFVQDVTDQRVAELAARRDREAAIDAASAKSKFLANMSHEIRTPINGIMGMASLLKQTELDARQASFLSMIDSSADHLLAVVNDLLDLSKIEAGKFEIDMDLFDLRSSVESVVESLRPIAERKQLALRFEVTDLLTGPRIGDERRIRQVLFNLISNAIKFTSEGYVDVRLTTVSGSAGKARYEISITDTGIGIAGDVIAKLFSPFTQADSNTSRKFGGTGLGLSICKQLVELMGGEIGVESREGRGSRFWFQLPLASAAGQFASNATSVIGSLPRRVLVADDNAVNRMIAAEMLKAAGLEVVETVDGAECLMLLGRERFDALVLDRWMPKADGIEVLRKLRGASDERLKSLKVIACTASDSPEERDEMLRAGADGFLSKPYMPAELLEAVGARIEDISSLPAIPEGRSVLIVEDSEVNQFVISEVLKSAGIGHRIAAGGAQALGIIDKQRFDLVLMDLHMPDMDGFETTRRIRAHPDSGIRSLPVIALTANAMSGERENCRAAGMDDYMCKPFKVHELLASILKWSSRGRMRALFIEIVPAQLDAILAAHGRQDIEALTSDVHLLRSRAASLGVVEVAEKCAQIERAIDSETGRGGLRDLLAELKFAVEVGLQNLKEDGRAAVMNGRGIA